MNSNELIQGIISQGKIRSALEEALKSHFLSKNHNDIRLLIFRFEENRKNHNLGLQTQEETSINNNKIANSLIKIISDSEANIIINEVHKSDFILKKLRNHLLLRLDKIDEDAEWFDRFTRLDANITIRKGKKEKRRKAKDLLKVLSKNRKNKIFLLIGKPGSGKSVALRRLTRELLTRSGLKIPIPLYINLKRWKPHYSIEDFKKYPALFLKDLDHFIISESIKYYTGHDLDELKSFLTKNYYKLLERGRLFLILDSFDEIPFLMDTRANDLIIDQISERLSFKFRSIQSKIIVASRPFRKPTKKLSAEVTLTVNPLTLEKMVTTFENLSHEAFGDQIQEKILKENMWLIPLARNPFKSSLIVNFYELTGELPNFQIELYTKYIRTKLEQIKEELNILGISINEIIRYTSEIAYFTFSTKNNPHGLEIPINYLKEKLVEIPITKVVRALIKIRIARITLEHSFTFVHRRFHEFFVSLKLIDEEELAKIQFFSVPNDTKWRDALVLYCEVADNKIAKDFVRKCWGTMMLAENKTLNDKEFLEGVHSLRFLNEAFVNRKAQLDFINFELFNWIDFMVSKKGNILKTKLALESICLLFPIQASKLVTKALNRSIDWISETATDATRMLPFMPGNVQGVIHDHFDRTLIETTWFYLFYKEYKIYRLLRLLKYSESFNKIRSFLTLRLINNFLKLLLPLASSLIFYYNFESIRNIIPNSINFNSILSSIGFFIIIRIIVEFTSTKSEQIYRAIYFTSDSYVSETFEIEQSLRQRLFSHILTAFKEYFSNKYKWLSSQSQNIIIFVFIIIGIYLLAAVVGIIAGVGLLLWKSITWLNKISQELSPEVNSLIFILTGITLFGTFIFYLFKVGKRKNAVQEKSVPSSMEKDRNDSTEPKPNIGVENLDKGYTNAQNEKNEPDITAQNILNSIKKSYQNKEFVYGLVSLVGFWVLLALGIPTLTFFIGLPYLFGIPIIFIIALAFLVIRYKKMYKDYRLLRKIEKIEYTKREWQRKNIEKRFFEFEHNFFRLRYLKFLDQRDIQVNGNWDTGFPPNLENDERSSELIAKLEAKWRGL